MSIWWWVGFNILVLALLIVDLGVFHRDAHEVKPKEALTWSIIWISLALLFNLFVLFEFGSAAAGDFLTGYLIEKSLSVDNLFVFVLIFSYFNVPAKYQHRILFWGIVGALVMRASLIGVGAYLLANFSWTIYIFGAFLVYTGIRMAIEEETSVEIEANPLINLLKRWLPVTNRYHGQKFLIRDGAAVIATPMLVVLVLIESTDLVFALDSIPAIFAVTDDTFIVYTSNIFAILGLRALYFVLASVIKKLHFLHYGLAVILAYIGVKMLISDIYHIPTLISLGVIAFVLTGAVVASFLWPKQVEEHPMVTHDPGKPLSELAPFDPSSGMWRGEQEYVGEDGAADVERLQVRPRKEKAEDQ